MIRAMLAELRDASPLEVLAVAMILAATVATIILGPS